MLDGYMTTEEARARLGYRHRQTVDAKCRAYYERMEVIRALGREPTAAERAPVHPRELACIGLSQGTRRTYLVEKAQLPAFQAAAGKRGRPLGSTSGTNLRMDEKAPRGDVPQGAEGEDEDEEG